MLKVKTEKALELKIREWDMIVVNRENKVAEEDKKLLGRKVYLLDKESKIG